MSEHRKYPSDLSDARWHLIGPVLADWREQRQAAALGIGRPPGHDLRAILNAYQVDSSPGRVVTG
ncbi:hypothetical protein HerbRD11066_74430 [Herbidospora sp. RD11066]